jgi:hypothetical protein
MTLAMRMPLGLDAVPTLSDLGMRIAVCPLQQLLDTAAIQCNRIPTGKTAPGVAEVRAPTRSRPGVKVPAYSRMVT